MPIASVASFDPDAYLAEPATPAFDPDAYLAGDKPARTHINWDDSGGAVTDNAQRYTELGGELGPVLRTVTSPETEETILRIGAPLLAAAAAPVTGGASLLMGGAGAFTGEVMAQESEMQRRAREKASYGRMVAAPAIAAIPLGPAASAGKQIFGPAGELLATAPQAILKRGAFGGVIGGGVSIVEQAIDTGSVDLSKLGEAALFNAAFGAIMGGVESAQMTRLQRDAMLELRKRTGQWQSSDLEFMDYVRNLRRQGPRAASAPAEEGAIVPPEQIQGEPAGYTEQPPAPAPVSPAAPEPPVVAGTPAVTPPPTTAAEPTVPAAAPETVVEPAPVPVVEPAAPFNPDDYITEPAPVIAPELLRVRAARAAEVELQSIRAQRESEIAAEDLPPDEDGRSFTDVKHPEAKRSWMVYEDNGRWRVENDGSRLGHNGFASKAEAVAAAKEQIRDEINTGKGTFGNDLDSSRVIEPIFEHFQIPEGAKETGWQRTKWGSWYNTVTLEDGASLKLSVRDHAATRGDMGKPDLSYEIGKDWSPASVAKALDRLEESLSKKARAVSGEANGPLESSKGADKSQVPVKAEPEVRSRNEPANPAIAVKEKQVGRFGAEPSEQKRIEEATDPAEVSKMSAQELESFNRARVRRGMKPARQITEEERPIAAAAIDALHEERGREYTPAIKTDAGKIFSAEDHETAAKQARAQGQKSVTHGFVTPDGKFLSLMEVGRRELAKKIPAEPKNPIAPEPVAVPAPPPAATVKQTEKGPVIAPTQREDMRVSKLVDRKQFKVQREYLLDAAKKALAVAPESATDYITFEVPGDGAFRVFNNQVRLKAFVENIAKRFGKPFPVLRDNSGGARGSKYITVHSPFSEPVTGSREAPGPRPVPALKTKPTVDDVTEAVKLAASTDPTRYALAEVVNENGFTVATDGRRLYLATGGAGKKLGADRIASEKAGRYPNWTQVLPSWIKADKGKITVGKDAPKGMFHVLTADAIRTINQAINATGEKANSIYLYKLGNGKIGVSSADPSFGDYRSDGVTEGMKADASVNPEYLRDAMIAARMTGNDVVKLYIPEEKSAVVAVGGNNFVAVTMPTGTKAGEALQHPDVFATVEKPGPARRKERETNIANAKNEAEKNSKATEPRASAAGSGTAGSTGFAAGNPGPGNFGQGAPPPADNPAFTQVPFQLPELVELTKAIMGGRVPRVVENIRLHQGRALGVFRYKEGNVDSGKIELKADVFHFLSQDEKDKLMRDAVAWATAQQFANPNLNMHEAIKAKFHELVRAAEAEAMKRDPIHALYVLSHELWHAIDFLPEGTLRRGNILGHMAAFKHYLEGYLPAHPGFMGDWTTFPTDAEKAKLRAKAEKELRDAVSEITETIKREVPIYAELPITADHITDMFKNAAREEFPDLYDWFARLDRADKVAIVKKAMKGIVDERAAKFAARTQTGTKIIEETVTRQTGEPVTPEAIRKRFDELLREELKFRGLVSELDIKRELQSTIAWWHGTRTMPAYFKTASEMFAEAGAIFMNNPAALAKRAPTFYRTLMNYIERRPEVQKAYDKVQADIKSGVIYKQRVENLRGSWAADAENALERELARKALGPQWRRLKDTFNLAFNKHQGPIQSLARKKLGAPESVKLLSALKDYLYRQTAVEGLARQINLHVEKPLAQNNLTHDDLSEFMFHKRIVNGDAQQTANSQGFSPNTSAARLEEMQQQLGPKRIGVLHQATEAMRAIYETGPVRLLEKSRALKPELMQFIKHNIHYSPFMKARDAFNPLDEGTIAGMLDSAYGQDISAKIFHRTGYLGDIQSPYVALLHKAESLTRFAYRQIALSTMADYMLTHEQDLIMEAPMHFNGHQMVPKIVTNTNIGTLLVMRDGTVKGYYVPRAIWETMENATGVEQMLIGGAMKVLSPFKAILTELNPGFWPVNFFRDLGALGLQMPRGIRSLANIPRAYKAARATLTGKDDKIADMLLNRLMVISRADPRGEHLGHPDEVNRWLLRMSKHPELWDAETKKISLVIRAWEAWKRQGQILERTVKGAGMMEMDKAYGAQAPNESTPWVSMPEWQKKELVNELAGSPDFNERGRAISIVEVSGGPMFVNAWLRGIEAFYKAQKRDPAGVWGKFLLFFGLPALAFFAYEMGWTNFGVDPEKAEDERDMLRSIPERDKLRGFVKTLGWVDKSKGKVAYVVLPFPEQARTLHAMLRKVLQSATGDNAKNLGLASLIQYQGQDLPGKNPVLSEGKKWWDYEVLGQNPYDEFRGRPTLDDDVFLAGEGAHELAKQTVSNLSGGFVTRYRPEVAGDNPTGIEKFLKAPFVSNIAGRWVRVSNAGVAERDAQTTADVARHQAQLRLVADEIMRKNLANEPWTDAEWQLVSVEDYLQQYLVNTMARQALTNGNGPEIKDFMRANTEQRQALLQAWTDRERQRQDRLRNSRPQLQAEPLPAR